MPATFTKLADRMMTVILFIIAGEIGAVALFAALTMREVRLHHDFAQQQDEQFQLYVVPRSAAAPDITDPSPDPDAGQ